MGRLISNLTSAGAVPCLAASHSLPCGSLRAFDSLACRIHLTASYSYNNFGFCWIADFWPVGTTEVLVHSWYVTCA